MINANHLQRTNEAKKLDKDNKKIFGRLHFVTSDLSKKKIDNDMKKVH